MTLDPPTEQPIDPPEEASWNRACDHINDLYNNRSSTIKSDLEMFLFDLEAEVCDWMGDHGHEYEPAEGLITRIQDAIECL